MSHKLSHGWRDVPIQELASQYLAQDGLTFDFDAGRECYDYQVSIGDEGNDALVGRGDRDHFWGLGGNDLLNGDRENDVLYGDSGRRHPQRGRAALTGSRAAWTETGSMAAGTLTP
ncbi:hypothetical protein LRS10_02520 [Phenylobacterium sp. J426]|uniref:hypothetical protein n=1 Tax=Phenylobacterium sp. J426 TaxID=2898439 RepID=UPI0021510B70|nr:hypothetical protein [Phenylobacterium sp. J426]MCR5873170.1 hypothetical protein [Phenylobacterium sp. J426]